MSLVVTVELGRSMGDGGRGYWTTAERAKKTTPKFILFPPSDLLRASQDPSGSLWAQEPYGCMSSCFVSLENRVERKNRNLGVNNVKAKNI